mmetsp:Transcript_23945/g.68551  ORF Transcript_23945/g.68551 Transcript_23945/m.68551 type:complete len:200 (+) Transcript_23945:505-1104(+)
MLPHRPLTSTILSPSWTAEPGCFAFHSRSSPSGSMRVRRSDRLSTPAPKPSGFLFEGWRCTTQRGAARHGRVAPMPLSWLTPVGCVRGWQTLRGCTRSLAPDWSTHTISRWLFSEQRRTRPQHPLKAALSPTSPSMRTSAPSGGSHSAGEGGFTIVTKAQCLLDHEGAPRWLQAAATLREAVACAWPQEGACWAGPLGC